VTREGEVRGEEGRHGEGGRRLEEEGQEQRPFEYRLRVQSSIGDGVAAASPRGEERRRRRSATDAPESLLSLCVRKGGRA